MPDERTYDIDPEIEALLAELDADDLAEVTPPADVWAGIERQLSTEPAPVVELASRRAPRFSAPALVGMAAAFLLIVAAAAVVMTRSSDETVLATAELVHDAETFDPLGADATATARLVEREDGFAIVLDDTDLPNIDEDADLELWLIEADDDGNIVDVAPVSLIGGAGSFEVPATLDVSTHRIVDISIEPRDGDDAHSGRSILRGTLTQA